MNNYKPTQHYSIPEILIIISVIIIFIIIRLYKYFETDTFVIWFDSAQFASVSLASVWSSEFWGDGIPPLYPFILKYFHALSAGSNLEEINFAFFSITPDIERGIKALPDFPYFLVKDNFDVVSVSLFQLWSSILAWLVFALSFSLLNSNPLIRVFSIIIILFMGIESSITIWDKHILTESIAISTLLLTTSILIYLYKFINNYFFLFVTAITFLLFSFIKITNNYMIIFTLPLVLFYFFHNGKQHIKSYGLLVLILIGLFSFNQYMLFTGDRTHVPMKDLISSRISTDGFEDVYQYFRKKGMPEIPLELKGKLWTSPFEKYPDIHEWWMTKSSKTYQKFLITHPGYFFIRPFEHKNEHNKPVYHFITPDLHFHEQVVNNKIDVLFSDSAVAVMLILVLIVMVICIQKKIKISLNDIVIPIFLILSGSLLYLIVWHADLGELDRHLLLNAIIVRLGLIMLILKLTNQILNHYQRKLT